MLDCGPRLKVAPHRAPDAHEPRGAMWVASHRTPNAAPRGQPLTTNSSLVSVVWQEGRPVEKALAQGRACVWAHGPNLGLALVVETDPKTTVSHTVVC